MMTAVLVELSTSPLQNTTWQSEKQHCDTNKRRTKNDTSG